MTELVKTEADTFFAILADPKQIKEIPVDTVKELWTIKKEFDDREAAKAFADAFNQMQKEITPVPRRGRGEHGHRYAFLDDIKAMLDPLLAKHGFSYSTSTKDSKVENQVTVVLTVRHTTGHVEVHHMDAPIDTKGLKGNDNKTQLHGLGSTYKYCTRYLLAMVCGVQTVDDDDGRLATGGGELKKIDKKQSLNLVAMMDDLTEEEQKFLLDYLEIDNIDQLPASKYDKTVASIQRKLAQKDTAKEETSKDEVW